MSPDNQTPADLIAHNDAVINKSVIPAMARQFDSINPVMSEYVRTILEPGNTQDFKQFLDSAADVLPLERLMEKVERNFANQAEPVNRPDNFGIPQADNNVEADNTHDYDLQSTKHRGM